MSRGAKRSMSESQSERSYIDLLPVDIRKEIRDLLMSALIDDQKKIDQRSIQIVYRQGMLAAELRSVSNFGVDARATENDIHSELGFCHPVATAHRGYMAFISEYQKQLRMELEALNSECIALEQSEERLKASLGWRTQLSYAACALHCDTV